MGVFLKVNKEKLTTAIENINLYIDSLRGYKNSIDTFLNGIESGLSGKIIKWGTKIDPDTGDPVDENNDGEPDIEKKCDYTSQKNSLLALRNEALDSAGRIETEILTPLTEIVNALTAAQGLINDFDGKTASLKEFLEGYDAEGKKAGEDGSYFYVEEVTVDGQTTEQLKFTWTDADGNTYELTIAEMVNSFYTEVGTTMNAMVAAGMYAESQGLSGELTKEQQQSILDGVKSFIGHAQAAHAFGVASADDINGVRTDAQAKGIRMYSPEDIASVLSGIDGTGGLVTAMGALGGFGAISAYTLTDMLDKIVPPTPTEPTKPTPTEPTTPTTPTTPTYPVTMYAPPGPGTDPGTYTPVSPTTPVTPTAPTAPTLIEPATGKLPTPVKLEPEEEDIDQLAREAFEEQFEDEEAYAEYQAGLIEEFDELFGMDGQAELREKLKSYGYNSAEIKEILSNQDLARNAFLAGEQSLALTELANKIATDHGIENFDTGYDFEGDNKLDFDYDYLYNGDVNEFLTNTNLDPTVSAAKSAYAESKTSYDEVAKTYNESVQAASEAKTNLDEYAKNLDKDKSKWTAEQATKYNEYVKKYNESYEKVAKDKEALDTAQKDLDSKKEEYTKAKEEYLKKIREDNKPDPEDEEPVDPSEPVEPEEGSTDEDLLGTLHFGDDGTVSVGDTL